MQTKPCHPLFLLGKETRDKQRREIEKDKGERNEKNNVEKKNKDIEEVESS